jgi:hypothetical protein
MRNNHTVSVIIPAFNEEASIGNVIHDIPDWVDQIIVGNNGSTDNTAQAALEAGAIVVVDQPHRGYGSACLRAMDELDRPDIVVYLDADYSDYPDQMNRLVDPIIEGSYDVVIGSRVKGNHEPGALTPQARFGNKLACWLLKKFWSVEYTDLGPFRAVRYSALRTLRMRDPDYGWTIELQNKAALMKMPSTEVPVDYRKRIGRSKVSGTVRGVFGAGYKILGTIALNAFQYYFMGKRSEMNQGSKTLIVFTRFPEPGQTKTRLIPALGPEKAAEVQGEMTLHALRNARTLYRTDIQIRYTGGDEKRVKEWLGDRDAIRDQGEGDLGQRMLRAIEEVFQDGIEQAVIQGIDSPDISPELLESAFVHLKTNDVVIGPALDGGYYLIGTKRQLSKEALTSLFTEIDWGTGTVCASTLTQAAKQSLAVHVLPPLGDVDQPQDLPLWEKYVPSSKNPKLTVIIPTLNAEECIADTIKSVRSDSDVEIIVSDGGSTDATVELVTSMDVGIIHTTKGRGIQMNAGAAIASSETLLFLHADTTLPKNYIENISHILTNPRVSAGAFLFSTDYSSLSMRFIQFWVNIRARVLQLPYGDQALFVKKSTFQAIGGFPEIPILEDLIIIKKLQKFGRILISKSSIKTSSRRWKRLGPWRNTLQNQRILVGWKRGIPIEDLAKSYGNDPSPPKN